MGRASAEKQQRWTSQCSGDRHSVRGRQKQIGNEVDWFSIAMSVLYGLGLLASLVAAHFLVTRTPRMHLPLYGWLLGAIVCFGGAILSSAATPDWSPMTMLILFLPFWAVACWAAFFARLTARDTETTAAVRGAALRTIPALLLAPLGLLIMVLGWMPGIIAASVLFAHHRARTGQRISPAQPRDDSAPVSANEVQC